MCYLFYVIHAVMVAGLFANCIVMFTNCIALAFANVLRAC